MIITFLTPFNIPKFVTKFRHWQKSGKQTISGGFIFAKAWSRVYF